METESILNSRPLNKVAEQPNNEETSTPNHFLIQRPFNIWPLGRVIETSPDEMDKRKS